MNQSQLFHYIRLEGYNTIGLIVLKENPSTGFTWHYNVEHEDIIQVIDNGYEAFENSEPLLGSGGIHTWTILPIKEGNTNILFKLIRVWQPEDVYATKEFNVDVIRTIEYGPLLLKIKEI